MIRTRFAPSPTGYLHIGGVRTALFSWAYAKKHQSKFVLRIEDTDLERSTPESVNAILDGMQWLGLDYDEGPFYQTDRMARYQQVIQELLASGAAYYCYTSKEELEAMKTQAQAENKHFNYDRRWRPEAGKTLPEIPEGVEPVVRFKMPLSGSTSWNDLVKGQISFDNQELDDLIIARSDGTPTYNLCVVVDDYDMQITHIIRGDDHLNNTPKQINILKALNGTLPEYAHLPMILNENGSKMSKRRDAVNVIDYDTMGILPEALLNYLARLGWSHQDDEVFSISQFITWFDLADINPSACRFDMEKLLWLNGQYIKNSELNRLATLVLPKLQAMGVEKANTDNIIPVLELVRDRANTLNQLVDESLYFYQKQTPTETELKKFYDDDADARLTRFSLHLENIAEKEWNAETIHALFAPFCAEENIKMGKLGMPLRIKVCGTSKTPSIDAVLALLGKKETLKRMQNG